MKKQLRLASESIVSLAIFLGILVLLNVLGISFFFRADTTDNQLFSLSDGSKKLVENLDDRMEIVGYFTEDLPPPFNATERYVRDLLAEYVVASKGNVTIRFVNPDTEDEEAEARSDGIQKVIHQVFESDSVSAREGYRGIAFRYLGETKAIPAIGNDTGGLEFQITTTIKEMVGDKITIGVVSGHGTPTLAEGLTKLKTWLPLYELKEVDVSQPVDSELRALLLIGPTETFTSDELNNLETYTSQGGSIGIFGADLKVTLEGYEAGAEPVDTQLNTLLEKWGLKLSSGLVADWNCGRAPMRGPFGLQVAVPYPLFPISVFDEEQQEHPALYKLPSAMFPISGTIQVLDKKVDGVNVTVLSTTSENSWLETSGKVSLQPKSPEEWTPTSTTGPFNLAVAAEGTFPAPATVESDSDAENTPSAKQGRVLIAGSAMILRNEFLPEKQGQQAGMNSVIAFALNSVDWLAQDADLIAIRAKNVEDPALDIPVSVQQAQAAMQTAVENRDVEGVKEAQEKSKDALESWETSKWLYRWGNTLGIPLLVVIFGLVRWRMRKNLRQKLSL